MDLTLEETEEVDPAEPQSPLPPTQEVDPETGIPVVQPEEIASGGSKRGRANSTYTTPRSDSKRIVLSNDMSFNMQPAQRQPELTPYSRAEARVPPSVPPNDPFHFANVLASLPPVAAPSASGYQDSPLPTGDPNSLCGLPSGNADIEPVGEFSSIECSGIEERRQWEEERRREEEEEKRREEEEAKRRYERDEGIGEEREWSSIPYHPMEKAWSYEDKDFEEEEEGEEEAEEERSPSGE